MSLKNFQWYLENTTICEYNEVEYWTYDINRIYKFNYDYYTKTWLKYYTLQSFYEFIDSILLKYDIDVTNDYVLNLRKIKWYIYEKVKWSNKWIEKYQAIKVIFDNFENFYLKMNSDYLYTETDIVNFYSSIWKDIIAKEIFKWNKLYKKIRESRNNFIEHNVDNKKTYSRIVSFKMNWVVWDNTTWRAHFYLEIDNNCYVINLYPILDFMVFLKELLNTI